MFCTYEGQKYFFIDPDMLGDDSIFPFHLHVHNPESGRCAVFLWANSPLTEEKRQFLDFVVERGGEVCVTFGQLKTFLADRQISEKDFAAEIRAMMVKPGGPAPAENVVDLSSVPKSTGSKSIQEMLASGKILDTRAAMEEVILRENYQPLIDSCREEVLTFENNVSQTTSLATHLCLELLYEDNYVNRSVAMAFHLAKSCGMKDQSSLGDIVVAAFFAHLGLTQLDYSLSHKGLYEMNEEEIKQYQQHPGLSQHVMRKSGVLISKRCHRIIYQHHEMMDGSGYPENKTGEHIDPLAMVFGAASHILELRTGKITGTETPYLIILKHLKDNTPMAGLELGFSATILESLIHLIDRDLTTREAA